MKYVWEILNFSWSLPDDGGAGFIDTEENPDNGAPPLLAIEDGDPDDDDDDGEGMVGSHGEGEYPDVESVDGSVATTEPEQTPDKGQHIEDSPVEAPSTQFYLDQVCESQVDAGCDAYFEPESPVASLLPPEGTLPSDETVKEVKDDPCDPPKLAPPVSAEHCAGSSPSSMAPPPAVDPIARAKRKAEIEAKLAVLRRDVLENVGVTSLFYPQNRLSDQNSLDHLKPPFW